MRASAGLRALLLAFFLSLALWGLARLGGRNWPRAAVLTSLILLLFFSYGHLYQFLEAHPLLGINLGRHRLLLGLWLVIFGIGYWSWRRTQGRLPQATLMLNVVSLVLLAFPVIQFSAFFLRLSPLAAGAAPSGAATLDLQLPEGKAPDIYFILLDEYTRQDVLQSMYGYDNSPFLDGLRGMGFQVVECAQSNYAQTELVLASVLNMDYVQNLGDFAPESTTHSQLRRLIKDSRVERSLRKSGYQVVAFETGFYFSEFTDADRYLRSGGEGGFNNFEALLFKSTLGLAVSDLMQKLDPSLQTLDTKRQQVLFDLEQLASLPAQAGEPRFIFAHLLLPHEPFIFAADGSPVDYPSGMDEATYRAAYVAQVRFLNQRLLVILKGILADSATPPVIIVMGDTGPGRVSHAGRMAVLSAIYLPGAQPSLPPGLTAANTFRLVFDQVFGADLALLEDRSYFSSYTAPYQFEPIPNTCASGLP